MADKPVQVISSKKVMRVLYVLCAAVVVLGITSTVLIIRDGNRVDDVAKAQKASCGAQGVAFAGILANTGLLLETAQNLKDKAADPVVRKFYTDLAPALTATLDAHFKNPPKCGEKFTFEINITGQDPRKVETEEK